MFHSRLLNIFGSFILINLFLIVFSIPTSAQGYVIEIQGTWKRSNRVIVKDRQFLGKGIKVSNVSQQIGDEIVIVDSLGKIIISCSDECNNFVVPDTQTWGEYLWCKIIGCGSKKYSTFATKGDECINLDSIAVIDQNSIADLSATVEFFSDKEDTLNIKFQRKQNHFIEEKEYDIKRSNPKIKGLQVGLYDVLNGKFNSRILILPSEIYEREKVSFLELQNKIKYWKEKGLSNCTIKSFTQSYIDYVVEKYKVQIEGDKKKTKPKS